MSVEIKQSSEIGSAIGSKESNCIPIMSVRAEDMNNKFKEKLNKALVERDDMWRRHEKEQIAYLQNQNSQMLGRLHIEIERLQNVNRDLERRLYVSTEPQTFDELRNEFNQLQANNETLKKELVNAENKNCLLAQTLEKNAKIYDDQIMEHKTRIRQLSNELDHRTLTITQLSTQLRNFKLREAMANAQLRRRASCIEPCKQQISPTALKNPGFRLFAGATSSASSTVTPGQRTQVVDMPASGQVTKQSASASASYPNQTVFSGGNRRQQFMNSLQRPSTTENNIEKSSIGRTLSGGILPTKPHLLHALRNVQEILHNEDSV